jgi:septin family protein
MKEFKIMTLGASGAGKTVFLASLCKRRIFTERRFW